MDENQVIKRGCGCMVIAGLTVLAFNVGMRMLTAGHASDLAEVAFSAAMLGGPVLLTSLLWHFTPRAPAPPPAPSRCQKCASTAIAIVSSDVHYIETTETITKRITHYTSSGEENGYSEFDEEVPVTRSIVSTSRRCESCGFQWKT
ncbi:MAG TPA: hypothetical protein VGJ96_07850 [Gemmatimonadaceae bacterium]|jgi:hypothetical protein